MLLENKNVLQLIGQIEKENLCRELISQVNKDAQLVGIDFNLNENSSPNNIAIELKNLLYKLLNNNFSDFINLLYRIDISEKQIIELNEPDTELLAEKSAILILRKEWQKVLFKSKNR